MHPLIVLVAGLVFAQVLPEPNPFYSGDTNLSPYRCFAARGHAAVDACTEVIRWSLGPADGAVYFGRANAYESLGAHDKAIADYSSALRNGSVTGDRSFAANVLDNRGVAYERSGQTANAISDFTDAIALRPAYPSAYLNRAGAYLDASQPERAIMDANFVLKAKPDDAQALFMRGMAYSMSGDLAKAVDDFSASIRIGSDFDARALSERCGAKAALNVELDRAIEDCDHALKLEPKSASAFFHSCFVKFRLAQFAAAAADCTASLEIFPKSASAFYVRGLANLGRADASGSVDIEQALSLDPKVGALFARFGIPDRTHASR